MTVSRHTLLRLIEVCVRLTDFCEGFLDLKFNLSSSVIILHRSHIHVVAVISSIDFESFVARKFEFVEQHAAVTEMFE